LLMLLSFVLVTLVHKPERAEAPASSSPRVGEDSVRRANAGEG
jgi:hypothetical protein